MFQPPPIDSSASILCSGSAGAAVPPPSATAAGTVNNNNNNNNNSRAACRKPTSPPSADKAPRPSGLPSSVSPKAPLSPASGAAARSRSITAAAAAATAATAQTRRSTTASPSRASSTARVRPAPPSKSPSRVASAKTTTTTTAAVATTAVDHFRRSSSKAFAPEVIQISIECSAGELSTADSSKVNSRAPSPTDAASRASHHHNHQHSSQRHSPLQKDQPASFVQLVLSSYDAAVQEEARQRALLQNHHHHHSRQGSDYSGGHSLHPSGPSSVVGSPTYNPHHPSSSLDHSTFGGARNGGAFPLHPPLTTPNRNPHHHYHHHHPSSSSSAQHQHHSSRSPYASMSCDDDFSINNKTGSSLFLPPTNVDDDHHQDMTPYSSVANSTDTLPPSASSDAFDSDPASAAAHSSALLLPPPPPPPTSHPSVVAKPPKSKGTLPPTASGHFVRFHEQQQQHQPQQQQPLSMSLTRSPSAFPFAGSSPQQGDSTSNNTSCPHSPPSTPTSKSTANYYPPPPQQQLLSPNRAPHPPSFNNTGTTLHPSYNNNLARHSSSAATAASNHTSNNTSIFLEESQSVCALSEHLLHQKQAAMVQRRADHERHLEEVHHRAQLMRRHDLAEKHSDLQRVVLKTAEAQERRQLHDDKAHRRTAVWEVVLAMIQFAVKSHQLLVDAKASLCRRVRIMPRIHLRARRWLRRARCRLYGAGLPRPTLAALKFDKMLSLFSDEHLTQIIAELQLCYYFDNETMIVMGCEEDKAYVMAKGSADVMMGQTKVFTMKDGMCFGTVGMISGEPRTASIVARGPCLVWWLNRATFEQRVATVNSRVAEGAHAIIRDLRKTNIRNVYKGLLSHPFFSTFATLNGVSSDTTQSLIDHMVPRVCRSGEVLCDPSAPPTQSTPFYFVLRGKLRVKLPHGRASLPSGVSLLEMLGRMFDLPRPKRTGATTISSSNSQQQQQAVSATLQQLAASYDSRHPPTPNNNNNNNSNRRVSSSSNQQQHHSHHSAAELVGEISGPLLLNLSSMFLHHHHQPHHQQPSAASAATTTFSLSPFLVETIGGCDVLTFDREHLISQDVLDLATMRQNVLNFHCAFMKCPPKTALIRAMFPTPPFHAMPYLNGFKGGFDTVAPQPWCYGVHDFLHFDVAHDLEAVLVLTGSLEDDPHQQHPSGIRTVSSLNGNGGSSSTSGGSGGGGSMYLWPDIATVFFGHQNVVARAATCVEGFRIRRVDLLHWLVNDLSEADLSAFVAQMVQAFLARSGGQTPSFADFENQVSSSGQRISQTKHRLIKAMTVKLITAGVAQHVSNQMHKKNASSTATQQQQQQYSSSYNLLSTGGDRPGSARQTSQSSLKNATSRRPSTARASSVSLHSSSSSRRATSRGGEGASSFFHFSSDESDTHSTHHSHNHSSSRYYTSSSNHSGGGISVLTNKGATSARGVTKWSTATSPSATAGHHHSRPIFQPASSEQQQPNPVNQNNNTHERRPPVPTASSVRSPAHSSATSNASSNHGPTIPSFQLAIPVERREYGFIHTDGTVFTCANHHSSNNNNNNSSSLYSVSGATTTSPPVRSAHVERDTDEESDSNGENERLRRLLYDVVRCNNNSGGTTSSVSSGRSHLFRASTTSVSLSHTTPGPMNASSSSSQFLSSSATLSPGRGAVIVPSQGKVSARRGSSVHLQPTTRSAMLERSNHSERVNSSATSSTTQQRSTASHHHHHYHEGVSQHNKNWSSSSFSLSLHTSPQGGGGGEDDRRVVVSAEEQERRSQVSQMIHRQLSHLEQFLGS